MKHFLSAAAALLITGTAAFAQIKAGGVLVNRAELVRNDRLMSVDIEAALSGLDVASGRVAVFTPMIVAGADTATLPSFAVYGRNRWYYYQRNGWSLAAGDKSWNKKDAPSSISYSSSVPYEKWMSGSKLILAKQTFGCCGERKSYDSYTLASYDVYVPSFHYMVPARSASAEKIMYIEGNAFVDFPVSETIIYPTYHNNQMELARIAGQIDSIRSDADVRVKSIHIRGYASPESPYDNNERLAKGRTESIKNYVTKLYDFPEGLVTSSYEPENWADLRTYVQASSLPDKAAILALIDSQEEPDRKEWLIKSRYKESYAYLLANCYPYLRRTYYKIEYQIRSFTEADVEHIRQLVVSRPQNLSLEEFYLAAKGLDPESDQFSNIFDVAVRMYPEDPVANINAANVAMKRGDLKSAAIYIERAGTLPEAIYARGVLAAMEGDSETAKSCLKAAEAFGIEQAGGELDKINNINQL